MQPIQHTCPKCEGIGTIPMYLHTSQGRCFQCNGSGYVLTTQNTAPFVTKRYDIKDVSFLFWSNETIQAVQNTEEGIVTLKTFTDIAQARLFWKSL
jgi:RecJ-like exonuclease